MPSSCSKNGLKILVSERAPISPPISLCTCFERTNGVRALNFFYFNSLKVTIKCLEKLNSYSVCSDCESGLKIELVKILKKFITKDQQLCFKFYSTLVLAQPRNMNLNMKYDAFN